MCAVFAGGFLLAVGSVSWAQDTVRLGGPSAARIDMQGGTDTELVRGFHGGYHGGYGHYHGGYRGGYYGGYYGGYRGYYGGYYGRGYGYGGYYRPYYGGYYGGYYRPYYGGYYGSYYPYSSVYYQPYYTSYYSGYYPCVGQTAATVTLAQANYSAPQQYAAPQNYGTQQNYYSEPLTAPGANSTFPYNGGPSSPIPMPAPNNPVQPGQKIGDPNRGIIPLDGKLVSLPNETTGGFTPVTAPARNIVTPQTRTPATTTTTAAPRVVYPAYGEEP
jgi:hypothetical protein